MFNVYFSQIEQPVDVNLAQKDLGILKRTLELLVSVENWDKNYQGHCIYGEKLNLYCALALAAKEKTGGFDGSAPYRHFLLKLIHNKYPKRYRYRSFINSNNKDPLLSFNNHPKTIHKDVVDILNQAIAQMEST